ncbi:MAG: hypothetical protein M3458_07150 [Acidobacteriota bacterium]|nr:hypothetical protein [Acidobacteriota bacterium]
MSDYLWDKSGEPDADVERLEQLLKPLRHQPRELQLPREEDESPASRAVRFLFRWPALAVAAALVLMALVGVWRGVIDNGDAPSVEVAGVTRETPPRPVASEPTATPRSTDQVALSVGGNVGSDVESNVGMSAAPDDILTTSPTRRTRKQHRRTRQHRLTVQAAPVNRERQEIAAEMVEARRAKEQLMLALYVASAKFNLAERKAPGLADVSPVTGQ